MADSESERPLTEESAAVQAHLQIVQSVIQRMANNSNSCKAWCITIVSAILVLIADKGKPQFAYLAFLPTILFLALDAYYLALERAFRSAYNNFVKKLHGSRITVDDVFSVMPRGGMTEHQVDALKSFSVWGFYGGLAALVVLAERLVLP